VNPKNTKYVNVTLIKAGQKHGIKIENRSFKYVAKFNIWEQHKHIKIACTKRLRVDQIRGMLATTRLRVFRFLAVCLGI
jgi:hypothetical protein